MADKEIADLTDGGAVQSGDRAHVVRGLNSRGVTLDVGAGLGLASEAQAKAGEAEDVLMNPLTTKQAITENVGGVVVDLAVAASRRSSDVRRLALLLGSVYGYRDGLADGYADQTGIDADASTNEVYDEENDLYSPSPITSTTVTGTDDGSVASSSQTFIDMAHKLTAGDIITDVGFVATSSKTRAVKIVKRNSAGNFDIVVSENLVHSGGGMEYLTLSSPYTVPGSGDYYLGMHENGTIRTRTPAGARASKSGDIGVGTGESGFTEDTSANIPPIGYKTIDGYENMTLVSEAFMADEAPDSAHIAVFIDPQESIAVNTDYTVEVSRDGKSTWTAATLVLAPSPVGDLEQWEDPAVDLSGQPSGTTLHYRKKTLNGKHIHDRGVDFNWS